MLSVNLNFINESTIPGPNVILYLRNDPPIAGNPEEVVIWNAFRNPAPWKKYPFQFMDNLSVAAGLANGAMTPHLATESTGDFDVATSAFGLSVQPCSRRAMEGNVQLHNQLTSGNVNAMMYMDGTMIKLVKDVPPGQSGSFVFDAAFYITVMPDVQQGDVIPASSVPLVPTYVLLMGIKSADIVMSGGGSRPATFVLQNIQMASQRASR